MCGSYIKQVGALGDVYCHSGASQSSGEQLPAGIGHEQSTTGGLLQEHKTIVNGGHMQWERPGPRERLPAGNGHYGRPRGVNSKHTNPQQNDITNNCALGVPDSSASGRYSREWPQRTTTGGLLEEHGRARQGPDR